MSMTLFTLALPRMEGERRRNSVPCFSPVPWGIFGQCSAFDHWGEGRGLARNARFHWQKWCCRRGLNSRPLPYQEKVQQEIVLKQCIMLFYWLRNIIVIHTE